MHSDITAHWPDTPTHTHSPVFVESLPNFKSLGTYGVPLIYYGLCNLILALGQVTECMQTCKPCSKVQSPPTCEILGCLLSVMACMALESNNITTHLGSLCLTLPYILLCRCCCLSGDMAQSCPCPIPETGTCQILSFCSSYAYSKPQQRTLDV